ncbi:hypothetical protein K7X08_010309 [Anisodus acutangulus]|uniref:Putative plant transposon protein domain-containing protein n=1 Tax=Anisodus acutangulus TaxID=402998 RepID=A0A9Q1N1F3_9SOLA|nr:hypothetical protein K7X08_010309 [Anisodus acutangulus]
MGGSSRTPSTSTPQAETEKEKEEEEMSDDIPLRNFIAKGVRKTYWNVASTSKATDEKINPDYIAPTSEATPASEQENTESKTDSEDTTSKKFEKVYLYNKVYNFTPNIINSTIGIIISEREPQLNPTVEELNSMIKYLTGNLITVWVPHSPISKITALFATLHKLVIYNWLPSLNETVVTLDQASLLFKIGRNQKVDLGTFIFNHVVNLAERQSNSALPYPSLIFQILFNQGFKTPKGEKLSPSLEVYSVQLLVVNIRDRVIDLPWKKDEWGNDTSKDVGQGNVPMSKDWLRQHIAKLDRQIQDLVRARNYYVDLLSSQKWGEDDADDVAVGSRQTQTGERS